MMILTFTDIDGKTLHFLSHEKIRTVKRISDTTAHLTTTNGDCDVSCSAHAVAEKIWYAEKETR